MSNFIEYVVDAVIFCALVAWWLVTSLLGLLFDLLVGSIQLSGRFFRPRERSKRRERSEVEAID